MAPNLGSRKLANTIQVRTCDPKRGFINNTRIGDNNVIETSNGSVLRQSLQSARDATECFKKIGQRTPTTETEIRRRASGSALPD